MQDVRLRVGVALWEFHGARGVVAVVVLDAAAGMGSSVPAANASCFSIFGIGNTADCTSTLTSVAIAIGNGAQAHASGFLGAAYSLGNAAEADATGPTLAFAAGPGTVSVAEGILNTAIATGADTNVNNYSEAVAGFSKSDFANIAVTLASDSYAGAGGYNNAVGGGNLALNLGVGNDVEANGFLNSAFGVGGKKGSAYPNNTVYATGTLNSATSVGGNGNSVYGGYSASSLLNLAFSAFGSGNTVSAGNPGPFALAGTIFKSGATVTKEKPGININGFKVPNTAAAVRSANAVKPSAAVKLSATVRPSAATKAKS